MVITVIRENIENVKMNIVKSCEHSGRSSEDVRLIAVSKTKPVSMLKEAYDAGCRDFGENKVQEMTSKMEQLPTDIRWHMIGHLQTNKIKYIVGKVYLIHSVDSFHLAEAISKEAVRQHTTVNILIEVNIAREATKYGVLEENVTDLLTKISALPGISVKGLMTIAPYVENSEENRQYFVKLRQLAVDIKSKNIDNIHMDILSMGMTGDYRVAVEEGATYVRVGTGIFGERQYNQDVL